MVMPLSRELLLKMDAYWRAANYLSVGPIHLVADVVDRVPKLSSTAAYVKQAVRDKLIEHTEYIGEHGGGPARDSQLALGEPRVSAARRRAHG